VESVTLAPLAISSSTSRRGLVSPGQTARDGVIGGLMSKSVGVGITVQFILSWSLGLQKLAQILITAMR
jgi:hypothetical protein